MKKTLISTLLITSLALTGGIAPRADISSDEVIEEPFNPSYNYEFIEAGEAKSESATYQEKKELEALMNTTGMSKADLDSIPDDAKVINFETIDDMKKFITEQNTTLVSSVVFDQKHQEVDNNLLGLFHAQTVEAATRKRFIKSWPQSFFGKLNLIADVTKNYAGKISSVSVSTSLTGAHWPYTWKQSDTDYRLSATKLSGIAYGWGEISYVLFFQGIGTLYSYNVDMELKFFASKI